ncbi:MAG: hypothetical protein L0Y54_02460, partial [Sporichthyaceae bacterium]|nr:hypothetical protein [Sporichthyaceae bacterium]
MVEHPMSPVSVWASAQSSARAQRRDRYVPASVRHPAKMLPAVAARAIAHYSEPGGLVLDPMCGIGTTLVEAVHQGRDGIGVECEPRWSTLAVANLRHARAHGAVGSGLVVTADARRLPGPLAPVYTGRAALLLTSPPYGPSVHGQVRTGSGRGDGLVKYHNTYGDTEGNLARQPLPVLQAGLVQILCGSLPLLRPDAHVVITARPYRRRGELVDFPGAVIDAARAAGLELVERLVACLAGLDGERVIPRASFFQLEH